MEKWYRFDIHHAQKNTISLYCRENEDNFLTYITQESDENTNQLIRDSLKANLNQLYLNQYHDPIPWVRIDKNFSDTEWGFDMVEARKRNGSIDEIGYLKYHIANAINETQKYRGFSRYAKKKIIGDWGNEDIKISFYENGEYSCQSFTKKKSQLFSLPVKGNWDINSNMFYAMNLTNTSGQRILLVDISDRELIFLGDNGQLFYIIERK